ncbi:MAG: Fe-S-containing protein [Fusobacteriaceae bacterium]|jgi:uncharacterized membrane protein|nr:Fe-S-containing protein [Fusobacteriaceae bacterium]
MLKYLIQVVGNLLASSLLVAGACSIVSRQKKENRRKLHYFISAGIVGIISALILSILRHSTRLINREYVNIILLPTAIVVGIIFIILALGALKNKHSELYENILCGLGSALVALLLFYALPDIFLYTTEFLSADESMVSTDFLFQVIGYTTGLILVVLTGISFFQVSHSLSEKNSSIFIVIGIFINIMNQSVNFAQILLARRIIPMTDWVFDILMPVINHKGYFLFAIMLVTLIIPVILWIISWHPKDTYSNPAEHRKIKAHSRRQRRWCGLVIAGYILTILCLTVIKAYNEHEVVLSPAEPMEIINGEIKIPISNVSDGHLHRFAYIASNGTEVRFIIIKKNEASYGVGLDACDICGATGYYERKNEVICKLCDVVMNKSTIGFKGGCNPVPLAFEMKNGNMVIQIQSLENEKIRFK